MEFDNIRNIYAVASNMFLKYFKIFVHRSNFDVKNDRSIVLIYHIIELLNIIDVLIEFVLDYFCTLIIRVDIGTIYLVTYLKLFSEEGSKKKRGG